MSIDTLEAFSAVAKKKHCYVAIFNHVFFYQQRPQIARPLLVLLNVLALLTPTLYNVVATYRLSLESLESHSLWRESGDCAKFLYAMGRAGRHFVVPSFI